MSLAEHPNSPQTVVLKFDVNKSHMAEPICHSFVESRVKIQV